MGAHAAGVARRRGSAPACVISALIQTRALAESGCPGPGCRTVVGHGAQVRDAFVRKLLLDARRDGGCGARMVRRGMVVVPRRLARRVACLADLVVVEALQRRT
jgi:hypothetical protein